MFVVLDNSKRTYAKTWILHLKPSHISIQLGIVMAFTLGQLMNFLLCISVDDPCVIPQTCDKLDIQFVKESEILLGRIPVVKCQI